MKGRQVTMKPEADGRDPALYKCKVLMQNSQPLIDPADLPTPLFPRELSEAGKKELSLFSPSGHVRDTYPQDFKLQDIKAKRGVHVRRSRTGLFTRYLK